MARWNSEAGIIPDVAWMPGSRKILVVFLEPGEIVEWSAILLARPPDASR